MAGRHSHRQQGSQPDGQFNLKGPYPREVQGLAIIYSVGRGTFANDPIAQAPNCGDAIVLNAVGPSFVVAFSHVSQRTTTVAPVDKLIIMSCFKYNSSSTDVIVPGVYLKCAVRSSASATHCLSLASERGLMPILNGFGSNVNDVGVALHSMQSMQGASSGFSDGNISNAVMRRMYAVYSSRFARCEPAHMRDPAPYA